MPRKPPNKLARPFTLRLTQEERAVLEQEAAGAPLGEYIRTLALKNLRITRKPRRKRLIKDHQLFAQLLAKLGSMGLTSNLDQLARDSRTGSLIFTPEATIAFLEACADIREIKETLFESLED